MSAPLLHVAGMCKRFGGLLATDSVDLSVNHSELHAIIGPNGAGKTTLIAQLTGELASDAGSIALAGTVLQDVVSKIHLGVAARARLGLGRSYQISQIAREFTALENVMLAVQSQKRTGFQFWRAVAQDRGVTQPAHAALERVGLSARAHTLAANLAHGEHRQLELAMTLALKPKVLLLDEPMAGMSPAESADMVRLITQLKPDYGILLVEHDMPAVFELADRISVLVYGKIIATGTPASIQNDPAVRAAYLGEEGLVA